MRNDTESGPNDDGYYCSDCGAVVQLQDKICGNCGADVSEFIEKGKEGSKVSAAITSLLGILILVIGLPFIILFWLLKKISIPERDKLLSHVREHNSISYCIGVLSGALVLFCFFLPWIEISAADIFAPFSRSRFPIGIELASDFGFWLLWLIPVTVLIALGSIYFRLLSNGYHEKEIVPGTRLIVFAGVINLLTNMCFLLFFTLVARNIISLQPGLIASALFSAIFLLSGSKWREVRE